MRLTVSERQSWWWRIALPVVVLVVISFWWAVAIGNEQQATGRELYGLFARTDSPGTGKIFWLPNGRARAFASVQLPYYVGLALLVLGAVASNIGTRQIAGWVGVVGILGINVVAALLLTGVVAWLWVNVIGVFI